VFIKHARVTFELMKPEEVRTLFDKGNTRLAAISELNLEPDRYVYLRNRAVSSMEFWGPNENGDAFPDHELKIHGMTFIGSRVSLDHRDDTVTGVVFDSRYIAPVYDPKFVGGAFVQNVLVVDKQKLTELAAKHYAGVDLEKAILNGELVDTSMGAIVNYTVCSVPTCRHIARTENEYCSHIANGKNRKISLASGETVTVFEECHDVTFFEDSLILPDSLGGVAGGRGADPNAEILQIIGSMKPDMTFPIGKYIVDRGAQLKATAGEGGLTSDSSPAMGGEPSFDSASPDDIAQLGEEPDEMQEERIKQYLLQLDESDEPTVTVKAVRRPRLAAEEVNPSAALDYLVSLLKSGKKFEEALSDTKKTFGSAYTTDYCIAELQDGRTFVFRKGALK
jgi:hypothetical protein